MAIWAYQAAAPRRAPPRFRGGAGRRPRRGGLAAVPSASSVTSSTSNRPKTPPCFSRPPVAQPEAPAAHRQPPRQLRPVHQLLVDVGHADHRPRAVELRPGPRNALAVHHGRHRELRRQGELLDLFAVPLDVVAERDLLDQQPLADLEGPACPCGRWPRSSPEALPPVAWACRQRRDRGTAGTRAPGAGGRQRRCGRRPSSPRSLRRP